jgi:Zn-dependent protease with chaperone function
MSAEVFAKCSCSECGNRIQFPIEAAGAVIACPHCQQQTQLTLNGPVQTQMPEPAPDAGTDIAPEAVPEAVSAVAILDAFSGPVRRTRTSLFYQLGLMLVTLTMIILPIIYLALVAAAAWGVYLYATHFTFLLTSRVGGTRGFLVRIVAYLGPLFVGVVLVFFMVKPLFARRGKRPQPLALNPGAEPTLYAFIARICETVGAPMPRRIDLDCQLNASAGFRRGLWSLFGHDLVLTIGVPLVAGLNLREFAGVVAHEFGHFTQGFGMRLSYIIRSINGWFFRVVYERDAWDMALEQWAADAEDWRVMLVVNFARLGVWFSRLLLKILMFTGHAISCFLLRQMEYDADSYEIKLAGSEAFESTAKRMAVLNAALEKAYKEMGFVWKQSHKLPDNFPAYLCKHEASIPATVKEKVQDTLGLSRTGFFDTHPSDGDRIRRARRAAEPGIFALELPSTVLFTNFEVISKQITHIHYIDELEIPVDPSALRAVETMPGAAV